MYVQRPGLNLRKHFKGINGELFTHMYGNLIY